MHYPLSFTSDQLTLLIFCFLQDFSQKIYMRTEQAEWCWTSEAIAFVPGFLPLVAYSRNPGTTAREAPSACVVARM
jgi:hypothetical protein